MRIAHLTAEKKGLLDTWAINPFPLLGSTSGGGIANPLAWLPGPAIVGEGKALSTIAFPGPNLHAALQHMAELRVKDYKIR